MDVCTRGTAASGGAAQCPVTPPRPRRWKRQPRVLPLVGHRALRARAPAGWVCRRRCRRRATARGRSALAGCRAPPSTGAYACGSTPRGRGRERMGRVGDARGGTGGNWQGRPNPCHDPDDQYPWYAPVMTNRREGSHRIPRVHPHLQRVREGAGWGGGGLGARSDGRYGGCPARAAGRPPTQRPSRQRTAGVSKGAVTDRRGHGKAEVEFYGG